jgi:hypothetical protein
MKTSFTLKGFSFSAPEKETVTIEEIVIDLECSAGEMVEAMGVARQMIADLREFNKPTQKAKPGITEVTGEVTKA